MASNNVNSVDHNISVRHKFNFINAVLTSRAGVCPTHEGQKTLAGGELPGLGVVGKSHVHALAKLWVWLLLFPET